MALPSIKSQFTDGNLTHMTGSQKVNRKVLILGTAEDGPMYQEVLINDISQAVAMFGRKGSMFRSINEAISAQVASQGIPQIAAVRIGGLAATKARLNIEVGSESVLTLEALHAGDVYNDIAVMQDANDNIKIYNPKTDTTSVFSYNEDPMVTQVDCHSVSELAAKINADPNLNEILVAVSIEKELFYEINVNNSDTQVITESDAFHTNIKLSGIANGDFVGGTRYTDGGDNETSNDDVDKTITSMTSVYSISESGLTEMEIQGRTDTKVSKLPLDGKADTRFATILNAHTAEGTLIELADDASGAVGAEAYLRYRGANLGKVELEDNATEAVFTVGAPWGIAHEAAAAADAVITQTIYGLATPADDAEIALRMDPASTDKDAEEGWSFSVAKPFQIEYKLEGAGDNDWGNFDLAVSDYSMSWMSGELTITIDGENPLAQLKGAINGGTLRISFDSTVGSMTEKSTLTALQASGSKFSDYFVRGKEILFGAPMPTNIVFRYATIQYYELGSTLEITDAYEPTIKITGESIQPGPGGAEVGASDVILGFKYDVAPAMFSLTATKTLSNGTNGINLSNSMLYDELAEAYHQLDDVKFQLVVAPGAYLDSTKTGYNAVSGLPQEVNAEFHLLMKEFLDEYNGEAAGIIGFKPLEGTGINGSVTRRDVSIRVEKETEQNMSDPLRAANFLVPFDAHGQMIAVDMEPVYMLNGVPYATTGEAATAGFLSTLASNESIYTKTIPGPYAMRYAFSEKLQNGKSQLDVLSDARIISAVMSEGGVRLTDGPTLAAPGSDYERWTTFWIASEAMAIVRSVAKDYLGKPASSEILQALDTRLRSDLSVMHPDKVQAVSFKIKSSPTERVLGKLEIVLVIVPVFEIRDITVPVILKADQN